MGRGLTMLALIALTCGVGACHRKASGVDDARMLAAASEPENWIVNGGDLAGRHYSALKEINTETVGRLGLAWSFDFDTTRGQESEPLVVDGVLYVTTAWSKVYALDAATGRQLWFYDPQVPQETGVNTCCDVVNRGAAVYHGKVYVGTIDGRLIALDAGTGKPVWSVQTTPKDRMYSITGAPRVARGKVIIGNGGAEFDARGFVTAYDAETGRKVWRFYVVPGQPGVPDHEVSDEPLERLARPTWFGDTYWKAGGGGTAWNAILYDPDENQILIGTGNGTPWNQHYRSEGRGDNLFLCSIVAVDPDTGAYKWHYQVNPGETWDYNATQPMMLADLKIGGQLRKVVMQAPKNGFFYVIDRTNGQLISATPIVPGITWASGIDLKTGRPIENPAARYRNGPFMLSPGPGGAHNWRAMAFAPETGLVYLGVMQAGLVYETAANGFTVRHGGPFNDGLEHGEGTLSRPPSLAVPQVVTRTIAFDPVRGRIAWSLDKQGGGFLATAGGLVFTGRGTTTGELVALDARNGRELWTVHTPNGVMPGPITYAVNGQQYIAVVSGMGGAQIGSAPNPTSPQPGRLLVFRLGGTARMPADPAPPPPFTGTGRALQPARISHGAALFSEYCTRCHGVPARASNQIPDLRRSGALADAGTWRQVVLGGALAHQGMVSWQRFIEPDDAEMIRDYIESEADMAMKGSARQPDRPTAREQAQ